jgi:hypothetical protein
METITGYKEVYIYGATTWQVKIAGFGFGGPASVQAFAECAKLVDVP